MITHRVRAHRAADDLPRERQLAWLIAGVAHDDVPLDDDVIDMVANRLVDNAAVAAAAWSRPAVAAARDQAAPHRLAPGATVFGMTDHHRVSPEWAAWANGVAVRELDFHDTYLAADYAHPADTIPPVLAVAQHAGLGGAALARGIVSAYEVQIALADSICLHEHRIDHIAHLGPAAAAGIGAALDLPVSVIHQAVQQAAHVTTTTRQSRKGAISSWKAYAPAFAGKQAVEAIDRALRGQTSPAPIWEGEDGIIARLLGGFDAEYGVALPERGEAKRAILASYTKEHSAEYQAQAFIDLAFRLRGRISDLTHIRDVALHTSHHTHTVIGTGAGDPQKFDPAASRETLDHSVMYIFAVALEDGVWHHERSYLPERAARRATMRLWRTIRTVEDPEWTARYHSADPRARAFGGRAVVTLADGTVIEDELVVADAHPNGARPFARDDYRTKFHSLTDRIVDSAQQTRFLNLVDGLIDLRPEQVRQLNLAASPGQLAGGTRGLW